MQLLFHDVGPYHIETSPAIQCIGFYMIGTSVMKEKIFITTRRILPKSKGRLKTYLNIRDRILESSTF